MAPISISKEASAPISHSSRATRIFNNNNRGTKQTASPSTIFSEFVGSSGSDSSSNSSPSSSPETSNAQQQQERERQESIERFESKNYYCKTTSNGHEARNTNHYPFAEAKHAQTSLQKEVHASDNSSQYLDNMSHLEASSSSPSHRRSEGLTSTGELEESRDSARSVSMDESESNLNDDKGIRAEVQNFCTAFKESRSLYKERKQNSEIGYEASNVSRSSSGSGSCFQNCRQLQPQQDDNRNALGISHIPMTASVNWPKYESNMTEGVPAFRDFHEEGSIHVQRECDSVIEMPATIQDFSSKYYGTATSSTPDSSVPAAGFAVTSTEERQTNSRPSHPSSAPTATCFGQSKKSRSKVKSASPLRIVTTTPLPAHLPALLPPPVSTEIDLCPNPHNHTSQLAAQQEESDEVVSSDIITPNTSPYSSLFTGRSSSIASSVPTTAASISYPISATCFPSSSTLNYEKKKDDNALLLSQQRIRPWCSGRESNLMDGDGQIATVSRKSSDSSSSVKDNSGRTSRYADFASVNISGMEGSREVMFESDKSSRRDHQLIHQSGLSNRPPLLRSVSEDTTMTYAISKHTRNHPSIPKQVRYVESVSIKSNLPRQFEVGSRYDSLPMDSRALTSPNLNTVSSSSSVIQNTVNTHESQISTITRTTRRTTNSPPSETSSRNASNSISSHYSSNSTSTTAASSKRSSWCSPEGLSQGLPPRSSLFSLSDSDVTIKQNDSKQREYEDMSTPSKSRHDYPQAIEDFSAVPFVPSEGRNITSRQHFKERRRQGIKASPASSIGGASSNLDHQETDINNNDSLLASFDPEVAEAIRRAAAAVRNQPTPDLIVRDYVKATPLGGINSRLATSAVNSSAMQNSLMGSCGNGYFGNAIRAKAVDILEELLPATVPILKNEDIVGIAEYGCLNSLSSSLIPTIISHFTKISNNDMTEDGNPPSFSVTYSDLPGSDFRTLMKQVDNTFSQHDYPFHCLNPPIYSSFTTRPFPAQIVPSKSISVGISLMDLHCRRTPVSTNGLSASAAAHNELQAFLNTRAMEIKKGGLLLLAFIQRQEDEHTAAFVAGKSKRAGDQDSPDEPGFTSPISSQSILERRNGTYGKNSDPMPSIPFPSTVESDQLALTSSAHALSTSADSAASTASFLSTSSASSNMSRRRSESSPCRPCFKSEASVKRSDIWSTIPALLAPCIQRLVSTGLIKSDTASHLLTLPLHPRTPNQTRAVLRSVQHQWRTEWSCGLPEVSVECSGAASPSTPTPTSAFPQMKNNDMPESLHEKLDIASANRRSPPTRQGVTREDALTLSHPAYTAVQSTTLSRVQFAEHAIQFIRVLYETHFRNVLKDHAKLSRSRLEEVLDALNEVLREKLEEPSRALLSLELEVCMLALRRV